MTLIGIKPLMTAFIALLHPFFISVVDISHNEKEASLELSVRTFTTDLETRILNKSLQGEYAKLGGLSETVKAQMRKQDSILKSKTVIRKVKIDTTKQKQQ